jgi:hypothetical protein
MIFATGGRERRHFDEVEAPLLCRGQRFFDGNHAELRAIGTYHPNGADPDLPVHPDARRLVVGAFDRQVVFSSSAK